MSKYYRIDENNEAFESLKFVSELLLTCESDITKWKWIIIALHNSLQNFMICSLRGSNNLSVLAKKSAKKWIEEFTKRMLKPKIEWKWPDEKLDYFPNLFEKIQSDTMLMYVVSKKFCPTESQKSAVIQLNYLRNEFIHFVPKGWSLAVDDLPNLVNEVISIIEFLAFSSHNIIWFDNNMPNRIREIITDIKRKICVLQ